MPAIDEGNEIRQTIRDFAESLTLNRPTTTVDADGYASDTDATSTISAAIMPARPKDLRHLPMGQESTSYFNIWSLDELKLNDKVTKASGSNAGTYEVQDLESWEQAPFWRGLAVRHNPVT